MCVCADEFASSNFFGGETSVFFLAKSKVTLGTVISQTRAQCLGRKISGAKGSGKEAIAVFVRTCTYIFDFIYDYIYIYEYIYI